MVKTAALANLQLSVFLVKISFTLELMEDAQILVRQDIMLTQPSLSARTAHMTAISAIKRENALLVTIKLIIEFWMRLL